MDKSEVKEVAGELIGWEGNKVFRTIKRLATSPGDMIREYCEGEKGKYISPVVYLFGITGIYLYLQSLSGLEDWVRRPEMVQLISNMFPEAFGITVSEHQVIRFLSIINNPTFSQVAILPLNLVITWHLFRKHNPSFKQSSWLVIYITSQSILYLIPALFCFWLLSAEAFAYVSQLIAAGLLVYNVWAVKQFYRLEVGRAILLIFLRYLIVIPFMALGYVITFYFVYRFVK